MKILLATDGSDYSRAATEFCGNIIADPKNTSLKIISAVDYLMPVPTDPMGVSTEYFFQLEQSARAEAKERVEQAKRQIQELFGDVSLDLTAEVIDGSPSRVIVETADEWGADLIVVGSHGHGFWERVLLGSVSDSVVRHAHCSVLAVRKTVESKNQQEENNKGESIMADKIKCGHSLCKCMVNEDDEYCSPQCEAAEGSDVAALECECGHSSCR
jgi:nucleotide-binding universal stress UspA family protein